jgi:hypothetical protein
MLKKLDVLRISFGTIVKYDLKLKPNNKKKRLDRGLKNCKTSKMTTASCLPRW